MIDKIKHIAQKYLAETIEVRRSLHKNPELSFKEYQTSNYIQSILSKNKIPFTNATPISLNISNLRLLNVT